MENETCWEIHLFEAENFRLTWHTHGKCGPSQNSANCTVYTCHILHRIGIIPYVWLWYMSGKGQNSKDNIADTHFAQLPPTLYFEVIFNSFDLLNSFCIEQPCRVDCRHSDQNKFRIEPHCTTSPLLSSSILPHLTWIGCMLSCSILTINTKLRKNCPCVGSSVNFRLV